MLFDKGCLGAIYESEHLLMSKFVVIVPNPFPKDLSSEPVIDVAMFPTRQEAIDFAKKNYNADDEGNFNLIEEWNV